MDTESLIASIGKNQHDLVGYEDDLKKIEPRLRKANKDLTGGLVALSAGVVMLLLTLGSVFWFFGAIFILLGGLATLTGLIKVPSVKNEREALLQKIAKTKQRLAEDQARLTVAAKE